MSQAQNPTQAAPNPAPAAPAAPTAPGVPATPPARTPYYKTGEVDWGDAGGRPSGGRPTRDIKYLKLQEGAQVTIRLVGKPFVFYKHWSPIEAISPGPELDICWKEGGHKPRRRYSCWVLDRADGQIKLFDFGPRVIDQFSAYKKVKQRDPGGEDGPNWTVSYEVPEILEKGRVVKSRRDTKWMIIPDVPAPLSAAEKKLVEEVTTKYPLSDVRKPEPPERIKELWEEAKRSPEGPIPGSHKWWVAKKEQRLAAQHGGAAGTGTVFDSERPAPGAAPAAAAAAPAGSEPAADDDCERLFADHGDEDSATLF